MKCELDAKYHNCPYLIRDTLQCANPSTCTYQGHSKTAAEPSEPVRQEKWFEKYYK